MATTSADSDAAVESAYAGLERARAVSELLDSAVRVPGTDFEVGLDPLLGVVPAGGDAVAAAVSLYPVAEAVRLGASRGTVARMLLNVALDAAIGSVPVVGTLVDAVWKANERNVELLAADLEESAGRVRR